MKKILAGLTLAIILGGSVAYSQTQVIAVNLATAKLQWQWAKGVPPTDGTPDNFNVKCAQTNTKDASGSNYATGQLMTQVPFPTLTVPISTAVKGGSGTWFCMVKIG